MKSRTGLTSLPRFERASRGSEGSSSSFHNANRFANQRWSTDVLVLDTNVISELMRPTPSPTVTTWLALQTPHDVFLTAITEAELRYGVALIPDGRRRRALERVVDGIISEDFRGRVLPFESAVTQAYARVVSERRAAGSPISQFDAQIAAICLVHGATLATRNVRDFAGCGLELVDAWAESTP